MWPNSCEFGIREPGPDTESDPKNTMSRRSSIARLSAPAVFRPGLGWVLVLLVGLLWSWSQAQAQTAALPLDSPELSYLLWPQETAEAYAALNDRGADRKAYACVKPPSLKCQAAKLILNEIADHQYPQAHEELWLAMPQTVPVQAPQPALPHIARQPLLRPPALLG